MAVTGPISGITFFRWTYVSDGDSENSYNPLIKLCAQAATFVVNEVLEFAVDWTGKHPFHHSTN